MCEERIPRPIDERRAKLCGPLHNAFPSYQVHCTPPIYLFATRRASSCLREGGENEGIQLSLTSNLNALAVPLKLISRVLHLTRRCRHDWGPNLQTLSSSPLPSFCEMQQIFVRGLFCQYLGPIPWHRRELGWSVARNFKRTRVQLTTAQILLATHLTFIYTMFPLRFTVSSST